MRSRINTTLFLFTLVLLGSMQTGCELINPDEEIPAFLCIDTIGLAPSASEGNVFHNITDAWVFENEQLIGVFEIPAMVPILKNGDANIRIRPGIKLNGQAGVRGVYLFAEDYVGTVTLAPDSVTCVNPILPFKDFTTVPWKEDFDENAGISLLTTDISEADIVTVQGEEAFDGKTAVFRLPAGSSLFECRSSEWHELPSGGASVILEFTYKCNHPFRVGVFSDVPGGTIQAAVIELIATDEWNHIYVNLSGVTSEFFTASGFRPFFGFVRSGDFEDEINVYIDNIRLIY